MLGNLKNPPEPFTDIIHTHYRLKAKEVTAQLDRWLAIDDGRSTHGDGASAVQTPRGAGGSSTEFRKDVDEMKKLLNRLQNNEDTSTAIS
jgi:hypothetical protein